jgi:hypothetical protein
LLQRLQFFDERRRRRREHRRLGCRFGRFVRIVHELGRVFFGLGWFVHEYGRLVGNGVRRQHVFGRRRDRNGWRCDLRLE